MATTKKKKEAVLKMVEEKSEVLTPSASELPEAIKTSENYPSILDPFHLLSLETMGRDIENSKLMMALQDQYLANLELQLKVLQNNIEKQKQISNSCAAKYELAKEKYIKFKKDIWPLYGLKEEEGLGYDPLSGFIKK